MNRLFLLFTLFASGLQQSRGTTGLQRSREGSALQRAGVLIKNPISLNRQTNDVLLSGLVYPLEDSAYKLQVLRMRIGLAWELVFTDYGFVKQTSGIDLINHRRRIAIELKNGYQINSMVKREDFRRLRTFKARHPRYTVILGIINDKTLEGKVRLKEGVHVMSGRRFLRYIFKGEQDHIIQYLRRAVQSFLNRG